MTRPEKTAGKKSAGKKIVDILLITIGVLMAVLIAAAGGYVYQNLNYDKAPARKIVKAGFVEKQVTLEDGTVLNYGEGPDNGPALLLIHGQGVSWEDYASVLPELSKVYHIYAVDCHGHGESSRTPEKYSAEAIGKDFVWFIEHVIGEPVVISGHSSGGLLTAWIAANSPENVRGIVLEDPPLFTTEAPRYEKTFAWVDSFRPIHNFLNQTEETDYPLYYLKNSYWLTFFGDGREGIIRYAVSYRQQHPDEPLKIFFLPPSMTRMFWFLEEYDPRFGDAFYDASWNKNFDHAEALAQITCPSVLIHTNWSYDANGILLAAMDDQDAERAHSLIKDNVLVDIRSGHDSHYEKPQEFIRILVYFLNVIQ